jgi:hypothetical protein
VGPIPANDTLMQQVKILLVYEGDKGGWRGGGGSHITIHKKTRVSRLNLQVKTS